MKRILLALAIAGASLATLSSCTKEYITNNNSLPGVSYVYPVKSSQWVRINGTNTYEYRQNITDLDDRYFQDGHVSVAISYDNNKTTYEIIPATIADYDYSANYSIGVVRIFAEDIGTGNTVNPPEDMYIKVVLTDTEVGN
ncbi:hypothetical protein SAMN05660841_00729 [Sphingobacterium nematocida]|uniref:DUF1735 domain-containing protein n=1 Tax=Sphingobacterium nematocida TaxID=1513896 RepID=A0A1T5BK45_9SPHI|nr:hypothetical protein [Sphingobacterium nematocida]SKB47193.1 hypothetical protein SAMN05660841_00729 [Sphingobacterium nematocida]